MSSFAFRPFHAGGCTEVAPRLSEQHTSTSDVTVRNPNGLHARPVMRFVDLAGTFQSHISVRNVSRNGDAVDGKSAMQMMLLEATAGSVLRIEAQGADAGTAVLRLVTLIESDLGTAS